MNKVGKPPRELNTFCVLTKAVSMEKLGPEVSTFKHRPPSLLFSCADPGEGAGGRGRGPP